MGQYLPILALLVLAVLFATISSSPRGCSRRAGRRWPRSRPTSPASCPAVSRPSASAVRFYLVAMIFIVFDIEIIFLYPWAMAHTELGVFGLVAVVIFGASVFESFMYLLSKGILEWGPLKRFEPTQANRHGERRADRGHDGAPGRHRRPLLERRATAARGGGAAARGRSGAPQVPI